MNWKGESHFKFDNPLLTHSARKYRILDDCSRLRDIIQAFPSERRFLPSLLIISWIEQDHATIATDFIDMVSWSLISAHLPLIHIL